MYGAPMGPYVRTVPMGYGGYGGGMYGGGMYGRPYYGSGIGMGRPGMGTGMALGGGLLGGVSPSRDVLMRSSHLGSTERLIFLSWECLRNSSCSAT